MKKLLLSVCIIFIYLLGFSQEIKGKKGQLFFSFKAGYTIPVAKSTVGSPRGEVGNSILDINQEGDYSYSERSPFGTRGAGFSFAASVGYMIIENFGIEMEFSFLRSNKILDARRNEGIANGNAYFAEQYSYTNMFRASPMLVVQGNPHKKFIPYAKFGALIPLAGKTIVEVNIEDDLGELAEQILPLLNPELAEDLEDLPFGIPTKSYIRAKTSGAFSVGFTARLGCEWNISDRFSLFSEMELNMLTVLGKETKFVDFSAEVPEELIIAAELLLDKEPGSIQGVYGLYDIPEIMRLTTYESQLTETSNNSYDIDGTYFNRDAPFQQLDFRDSYNSFGLMLGFRYKFKN